MGLLEIDFEGLHKDLACSMFDIEGLEKTSCVIEEKMAVVERKSSHRRNEPCCYHMRDANETGQQENCMKLHRVEK